MSDLHEHQVRDLLHSASLIRGTVDPDDHWRHGRRRRAQRWVGVAGGAGLATAAVLALVAQTGLLGGPTPSTGPAAVPGHLETFVFGSSGSPGEWSADGELRAATSEDLLGTSWTLQEPMYALSVRASELTGTTAPTVLSFSGITDVRAGWGLTVGGCGTAGVESLDLNDQGDFAVPGLSSNDVGCPEDVQVAEDFWMAALEGGGRLNLLDDGRWLLLSVDAPPVPDPGPEAPATVTVTETATETATETSTTDGTSDPPATEDRTATPTLTGTPTTGTVSPPAPPTTEPSATAPAADGGPAFVDPSQEWVAQPWPAAGGDLLAPTVRAGVHEGFDRVVVDLTGTDDPGWRAAYTDDPRLDGSGLPSDIAGDSVLQLSLTRMAYPEEGSAVYAEGIFGLDTHTLAAVVEVQRTTPFEGMLQVFVGMQGEPRPYRVFLLQDPLRLVVDVQTS
ncbi:hypothetical protein [Ornithinimicrobium sp. LYQ103]|uniref:AMIN-like domain-containing (lipo)protein n=1 Tax=Ornithinimicrobium sp. LYQ103 TaxID=3378796 RepID=UPI0038552B03